MHNNDEINEAIQHFKLTKKDQQLLVAGATLMTVATAGAMATTANAHADTVKNNNVKTEQVNKVNNNVNNGWHANSVAQIKQAIQKQGGNVYTIQYGDTLSAIAQAMNINMATLQQINHIANANVIIAGNKIGFSADHQNVQVMNNQGKVIAQAPVHAKAPVTTPVVNHAVATPVAHTQVPVAHTVTPAPVVHTTTVNKPVTTTHTEYVPQQVTTTKEVPTQVTTNQTKTVTKNVPVTTTDANGNQTTTMKPETTTETVPVTTTVNKPVTTTTTVNKPVTVTDTTNQPTTTTTTTPSQTPSSSVDNGSSSVANSTTSTTNNSNSNVDNSSSSSANTANSGQLVNGYTPQQSSSNSSSANSSSSADSSSSQTSQSSSSSSSMSNGYQPQNNQNNNDSTRPQLDEYVNSGNGFDWQGFVNYFNADDSWQCGQEEKKGNYDDNYDENINLLRSDALKAINEIRANAGVAPVQYSDFLNNLEQSHAEQMTKYGICRHDWTNADGSDSGIMYDTKYIQDHNAGNEWDTTLEDASAQGSGVNEQDIIDRLFAGWLSDEGHRDMLISPDYKYIGFGWDDGMSAIDGQTPVSEGGQPLGNIISQTTDQNGSWQISVH